MQEALKRIDDLHRVGRFQDAAIICRKLIIDNPHDWRPISLLGTIYAEQGWDNAAAMVMLTKAVEMSESKAPEPLTALGTILRRTEHYEAARYCYDTALVIAPDEPFILRGLAGWHVNQGIPKQGIPIARQAVATNHGDSYYHANNALSLLLLEDGQWEEGFRLYRERWKLPGYHVRDYGNAPRWNGKPVKKLALHAEQGLGDEIMFGTVIAEIKPLIGELRVEVNERLVTLLERSWGVKCCPTHEAMGEGAFMPDKWDRLADVFGSRRKKPSDCPGTPYLKADPIRVASYRERLKATGEGPYIGLAWLGGAPETHARVRRAPKPLWLDLRQSLPGTAISLQYSEEGAADAKAWGLPHWPAALTDMEEFAALVMALDLTISSPQTAVHFAGALGKECWVASPAKGSWPFRASGETMAVYNSVKLFWQDGEDWKPAFDRIKSAATVLPMVA